MRNVLFLQAANHFNYHSAAGLIVATQDSRAVGANDVAFDNWFDAFTGNDRIHMRAHHDRCGAGNRARKTRDDVPAVAANLLSGIVDLDLSAHLFAVLLKALSDVAFLAR